MGAGWEAHHHLLMNDRTAPNFCSALVMNPMRYRHDGVLTCKLVLHRDPKLGSADVLPRVLPRVFFVFFSRVFDVTARAFE